MPFHMQEEQSVACAPGDDLFLVCLPPEILEEAKSRFSPGEIGAAFFNRCVRPVFIHHRDSGSPVPYGKPAAMEHIRIAAGGKSIGLVAGNRGGDGLELRVDGTSITLSSTFVSG